MPRLSTIGHALCVLLLAWGAVPAFAQTFPKLTGRVVDQADLLPPAQEAALEAKLAAIEQRTGHQLVVATVPDLQGYPIEDYGYRLGRAWALGDKEKDDGAILLVARDDRKLRIEVGYGLEPLLTDAYSSVIVNSVITPRFKAGDFAGGIDAGVDAIAEQIALTPEEAAKRAAELSAKQGSAQSGDGSPFAFIFWFVIIFFVVVPMFARRGGGRRRRHSSGLGQAILWTAINVAANSGRGGSGWGGGSDWGGGGGGGFSGGGGSFGGGGASGGW